MTYVKVKSDTARWERFCKAVKTGDAKTVGELFNAFLSESISIRDTAVRKENFPTGKATTKGFKERNPSVCFYHGLFRAEGSWNVKSNAESGTGYSDILLIAPREKTGCIIEVKYAEGGVFDAALRDAME